LERPEGRILRDRAADCRSLDFAMPHSARSGLAMPAKFFELIKNQINSPNCIGTTAQANYKMVH
jgi:hypothetical protein